MGMSGFRLDDEQRLDWLQLLRSEGIGPRTFRTLIGRYGTAAAVLKALPELGRRRGRPIRMASRGEAEREMAQASRFGVRFVAPSEPDYPLTLRAIDTAPPLIGLRGDAALFARPMVSIVGSRNASAAGLKFTQRLARELGEAGFVVVSGLARGIDTSAHNASLATGTVAVLAGGHDRLYPAENAPLLDEIVARGVVVSEMPMGWEPRGRDFPRRNRIVSGLSLGVVVVEAARRSGSLITARFALEQGREVFAVPGSPLDLRAEGTNDLIREGATLCASAEDVVRGLAPLVAKAPAGDFGLMDATRERADEDPLWDELDLDALDGDPPRLEGEAPRATAERPEAGSYAASFDGGETARDDMGRVIGLLGATPVSVDDLVRASGLPIRSVQLVLFELELAGKLVRHGGNAVSLA
ncbi:DNA-processing protein DprA [Chelatococcus caeni]|nr:DNA-processing protein DprA [Chelatococcus caeni]